MSASHPSADCGLQVPSWDEFDHVEEPDDDSELGHEPEDGPHHRAPTIGPVMPIENEANLVEHEHQIVPRDVHQNNGVPSIVDHLPNSLGENAAFVVASSSQTAFYGPSLPPGYNNNCDEDDPDDPEDPGENGQCSTVPNMRFMPQDDSSSSGHPADLHSQRLPEDCRRINEWAVPESENLQVPPPEPGEAGSSSSTQRVSGPMMPDLLPMYGEEEREDGGLYGPVMPFDLQNLPSTSALSYNCVEVPIEEESGCQESVSDSDIIGPVPPWEQKEGENDVYAASSSQPQARQQENSQKREEWMLQPPKRFNNFVLNSRKFTKTSMSNAELEEGKRDWTETPEEREKLKNESRMSSAGPSGMSSIMKNGLTEKKDNLPAPCDHRGPSLVEMHQGKRKRDPTNKDQGEPQVRRPFDREQDIESNCMKRNGGCTSERIKEHRADLCSRFKSSNKFL